MSYLPINDFEAGHFVIMATTNGIVKKTDLAAYSNPRTAGVRAINIDEGDSLCDVRLTDGNQEIFLATQRGLSLRFSEQDVRTIGRVGRGVIGIRLNDGDRVVGMEILQGDGSILTLTENGYGKKTSVAEYRVGSRGNKGVFTIKTTARSGNVIGIAQLTKEDEVMLITRNGKLIRFNLSKLRNLGRLTQGVRLIHLESDEQVVAIAKIAEGEDNGLKPDNNGDGDDTPETPLN
jgi:DNA gyrase subunit A